MSKNFVREIEGIKNINKQEFYTNKANDLLSTKEHNYIRKETEQYHCLTDNVKQTKATNVRYTDTTAKPNVNYNLLTIDNTQVPNTNTNTLSATSLVEALEAKDQQIQELKNKIDKLKPESKPVTFEGVLDTHTSGIDGAVDGFLTAKTVTPLSYNDFSQSFLVHFNFTGKLQKDGEVYTTYIDPYDVDHLCINFIPNIVTFTIYRQFEPKIYANGLTIVGLNNSGQLKFEHDGTFSSNTISTSVAFTLKVTNA